MAAWQYDAEGNLLSDGTRQYRYDQGNRLTEVRDAGGGAVLAAHAHDAAGRRARLEVPGGAADGTDRVEHHAHAPRGDVLLVADAGGAVLNAHLHGPRPLEALAEGRPAAARAALADLAASYDWSGDDPSLPAPPADDAGARALADAAAARGLAWTLAGHDGGVRDVLDAAGEPLRHLRYGPFGVVLGGGEPDPELPEADPLPRHGYTGHAQEWHTADAAGAGGLVFMNARFYDPATGRFLNQDPLGFGGGPDNLYSYAGNDPVNHVDPTGEFLFPLLAAATPYLLTAGAVATAGAGALAVAANNSDSFAGFLADMGGDLADFFGVDDFTLPLGFASVSFGRAEDGSQYFGFGGMISINGFGVGLNTLVTEDARGTRDSNVGASVGFTAAEGVGLSVGVGPGGDFTAGLSLGPKGSPITAGPTATYGQTGFRPGVGVNARLPVSPLTMNGGYAPTLDLSGGFVYGDDTGLTPYGSVGVGFARRETASYVDANGDDRTVSHWVAATELPSYSWSKVEGQPTRTSLSWNPFAAKARLDRAADRVRREHPTRYRENAAKELDRWLAGRNLGYDPDDPAKLGLRQEMVEDFAVRYSKDLDRVRRVVDDFDDRVSVMLERRRELLMAGELAPEEVDRKMAMIQAQVAVAMPRGGDWEPSRAAARAATRPTSRPAAGPAERSAFDRFLIGADAVADAAFTAAGAAWNAPNTVLLGGGFTLAGAALDVADPILPGHFGGTMRPHFANGGIEVENNPLMGNSGGLTLGNVMSYGVDSYTTRFRFHERQHVPQGYLFGPGYLGLHAAGWALALPASLVDVVQGDYWEKDAQGNYLRYPNGNRVPVYDSPVHRPINPGEWGPEFSYEPFPGYSQWPVLALDAFSPD